MSTRKSFVLSWLLPATIAITVSGLFLFWQWTVPSTESEVQSTTDQSTVNNRDAKRDVVDLYTASESSTASKSVPPRFSAAHVNLGATRDGNTIQIELDIASEWHINANPASFDFLIPTDIKVLANGVLLSTELVYPAGDELDVGLEDPIRVYSGKVKLIAALDEVADNDISTVEAVVQACNDSGLCLPPSTLSTSLPSTANPSLP
ncbi:protein-disulfide reductase DsbD N-terminal domain-containing protein [Salinisphaera orenii]|uniref:protein-disulfide reductase DsbD N-terminal domain-containing protein n=1 Tax=Salinisphaera orenii TaxID=856731 RepID=UPI001619E513|nr:protein-disulfide reductase DsbD N-terminal domain-containing protein [Salinisphaera orenii]